MVTKTERIAFNWVIFMAAANFKGSKNQEIQPLHSLQQIDYIDAQWPECQCFEFYYLNSFTFYCSLFPTHCFNSYRKDLGNHHWMTGRTQKGFYFLCYFNFKQLCVYCIFWISFVLITFFHGIAFVNKPTEQRQSFGLFSSPIQNFWFHFFLDSFSSCTEMKWIAAITQSGQIFFFFKKISKENKKSELSKILTCLKQKKIERKERKRKKRVVRMDWCTISICFPPLKLYF